MKRGIVIIIVGLLLLIITAIVWAVFQMGILGGNGDDGATVPDQVNEIVAEMQPEEPTPVPQTVQVVVAVQNIGRGMEVTLDSVSLWDWPVDALPPEAIVGSPEEDLNGDGVPDAVELVLGQRLRNSVSRFEPILESMLADRIDLTGVGSDAALAIPNGRMLMALPLPSVEDDPTSAVAYALRPGDHVDLMLSLALIDLDEEFHTKLPNNTLRLDVAETETGQQTFTLEEFPYGRIEEGPLGLIFNVIPSEDDQRSRLVTQLTVQDALVVRVGRYPTAEEETLGIDPLAPPTPTPLPDDVEDGEQPQTAPPEPDMPQVVILAVTPQEALVIKFAWEINADIDFALRAVGDQALYQTNSVTLQYLMETYNIEVPPKLQYGIEQPVELNRLVGEPSEEVEPAVEGP
jgi:Flp pilus assembly protein CpaB